MTYTNFYKVNEEKGKQIIDAAIKEFVSNGFDQASTNEIVKAANISKGSLFNYFQSKKGLYRYLVAYSLQIIEDFYEKIDFNETDLFKRIEAIGLLKLQTQQTFPHAFDFLASAVQEESSEVKEIVDEKVRTIHQQGHEKIYQNIDYSMFKEDVDIEKAIEILNWTLAGFGEKGIQQMGEFSDNHKFGAAYYKQWKAYADLLKISFYKEDAQ